MADKERPGVEEEYLVHHHDNDAEVPPGSPSADVIQEELVTQHLTTMFLTKKHRPFLALTSLKIIVIETVYYY